MKQAVVQLDSTERRGSRLVADKTELKFAHPINVQESRTKTQVRPCSHSVGESSYPPEATSCPYLHSSTCGPLITAVGTCTWRGYHQRIQ